MFPSRLTRLAAPLLASALLAGVARPAHAGRKTPANVVINTTTRTASGSLGSTRNTTDNVQYIACQGTLYPNLDPTSGSYSSRSYFCYARTTAGASASCTIATSTDPLVDIQPTLAEDSFVEFKWNASGYCTSLRVENYSYYAPVQP